MPCIYNRYNTRCNHLHHIIRHEHLTLLIRHWENHIFYSLNPVNHQGCLHHPPNYNLHVELIFHTLIFDEKRLLLHVVELLYKHFLSYKSIWFYIISRVINIIWSRCYYRREIKPPRFITWCCVFSTRVPCWYVSWIYGLLIFCINYLVIWAWKKKFASVKSRLGISNYSGFFAVGRYPNWSITILLVIFWALPIIYANDKDRVCFFSL